MAPDSGRVNNNYIFLSYSHRDSRPVLELAKQIRSLGYNIWYDEGIVPGSEWDEHIAKRIERCKVFISYITRNYLDSQNCLDELNYARDLDNDLLLIYGENVELPSGMKMRLNRRQAIYRHKYPDQKAFVTKVLSAQGIGACRRVIKYMNSTEKPAQSTVKPVRSAEKPVRKPETPVSRPATRINTERSGNKDVRESVSISLEEAYLGCSKLITIHKKIRCTTCAGTGRTTRGTAICPDCKGDGTIRKNVKFKVTIPAGIVSGEVIRLRRQGNTYAQGEDPGDLLLTINVRPHDRFVRKGDDLYCSIPVSFAQAQFGSEITIPSFKESYRFTIEPGTKTGSSFRLRGKGMRNLRTGKPGDLYVTVVVKTQASTPGKASKM